MSRFSLGQYNGGIGAAWRALRQTGEAVMTPAAASHILAGFAVLALVGWRIALRLKRSAPPAPVSEPAMLRLAAAATHLALYALMIGLVVSGGMAWFGGVGSAMGAHKLMKTLLIALIGLHVMAALWHQFWLKDRLMLRMMRAEG